MNDPRLLTLLTLIKVKSYTKTAERLFITQPAVSQHIKSLEHQYDITIFDGTKGFNLTKQGQILVEYARRMQNQDIQLKEALFNSLNNVMAIHPLPVPISTISILGLFLSPGLIVVTTLSDVISKAAFKLNCSILIGTLPSA